MSEKRILLIIGGGIAAFKSLELIRTLSKAEIKSRVIVTQAGTQFVTPLSVSALSGEKVFTDLFDLTDEAEMGHIELSRSADLVVVCPATADLLAKAAHGHANDLASTALMATDKKVLFVPAMNVRMWEHPATQENVKWLNENGASVMEPDDGAMACGEFGPGRLPDTDRIAARIRAELSSSEALKGKHAVITAGPTREPIDPVRYLSNHSSGQQGYAIAEALANYGAKVTLVSGPTALSAPTGVERIDVETAREMLKATENALPADIFIAVAAVADWRPKTSAKSKLKLKGKDSAHQLELTENPDILKKIAGKRQGRPELVVGFAAETDDVAKHAQEKRERKKCDWIVANDVSGDVMGGSFNAVTIYSDAGAETMERAPKPMIAQSIADRVAAHFSKK